MPFLRIEKKSSGTYLRILESYRTNEGKPTHRTLYSLGKVEDYTPEQLRRMGIKLFELGGGEVKSFLKGDLVELGRYNYGYQQVYGKALHHYGFKEVFGRLQRTSKITFSLYDTVLLMLLERLHEPASKLQNYHRQNKYLNLNPVKLHHLYRALDVLAKYNEVIQLQIYQTGRDLFNSKLDVVFYDVTTFYFQSEVVNEDALRQMGFGKDGKIGKTQILFSMMIDQNKNPIGYQVFKGDTYEGDTFKEALKVLKRRYNIGKVIVVADRGMLSKSNIEKVVSQEYDYILGERLKSLPKDVKESLIDRSIYKNEWIYLDNEDKEIKVEYTTLEVGQKTIICTYSEKRAKKDRLKRLEKIEKAHKLLKTPSQLKKKAGRYFIKSDHKETYVLDEQKIANAEKYDGFLAISTNTKLAASSILDQYKQLYKIEQSFRTFKSHLELRPMFHWTDRRIEGHICMCYIAFTLQQWVLTKSKNKLTERTLRQALDKMQVSHIQNEEKELYLRSNPEEDQKLLQNALKIKALPPMMPIDYFKE
ncbi:MAG: IS1634 family transposase [Bacteroidota bacterium]